MFLQFSNVTLGRDGHIFTTGIFTCRGPSSHMATGLYVPYLESSLAGHIGLSYSYGSEECLVE